MLEIETTGMNKNIKPFSHRLDFSDFGFSSEKEFIKFLNTPSTLKKIKKKIQNSPPPMPTL